MATRTYSPNEQLPASVAGPISQQISQIQAGINTLRSSGSSAGVVNAQGQLVGAGGQVMGVANPADRYSPNAIQAEAPQAGTQPIEPTPGITQATPYTVQKGDTLSKIAQAQGVGVGDISGFRSGDPNRIFPGEQLSLGDKYNQAKQRLDQLGVSPVTAGQGSAAVQTAMQGVGGQEEPPSILGGIQETDSNFDSLFLEFDKYFSPQVQRTSLVDEYSKLSKSLGLDAINTELIDTKRIIDGTEDDIRSEITGAGGLATDSQVLAMANARNKSLIKNYNYLLDTKNAATTQLSTLMELTIADRQSAEAEFDRKMDFGFKVAEFKQRATDNARGVYSKMTPQQLMAITNGNAYEQGIIEKTMGWGQGGLQRLASLPPSEEDQLDLELKRSQLKTDILQREKLQGEIDAQQGTNGIDEKTMGKIQSSPEYKTISGVLPALNAIKEYANAVKDTGSFEWFSGTKAGNLKATYGNALSAWKTLATLGALSGADFGLAENVIPAPGLFTRNSKVLSQLETALENGITQSEIMTRRLSQNYPVGNNLFNQQLDDMRVLVYPDRFVYSPDGTQVIELTD